MKNKLYKIDAEALKSLDISKISRVYSSGGQCWIWSREIIDGLDEVPEESVHVEAKITDEQEKEPDKLEQILTELKAVKGRLAAVEGKLPVVKT